MWYMYGIHTCSTFSTLREFSLKPCTNVLKHLHTHSQKNKNFDQFFTLHSSSINVVPYIMCKRSKFLATSIKFTQENGHIQRCKQTNKQTSTHTHAPLTQWIFAGLLYSSFCCVCCIFGFLLFFFVTSFGVLDFLFGFIPRLLYVNGAGGYAKHGSDISKVTLIQNCNVKLRIG